jgi:DNA-binding beta-propeller fold protein YncE
MKAWGLAAVLLLAGWVAGCGGNSTAVGITITGPSAQPLTIIISRPSVQFVATVTGVSASTVFWQICQPLSVPSATLPPTMCTQGQGPTGCPIPTVKTPLTGVGTITVNGLYTPPATVPNPASLVILATSCVRSTAFTTFAFILDSGIRVQVIPNTATINPGDNFQFQALVTGTNDSSVVWLVNSVPGGDATHGFICPDGNADGANLCNANNAGEYFAPNVSPGSVTVGAQSGADPKQVGTATVTIAAGSAPSLSGTTPEPQVAAEGSIQQDVYLQGSDILTTTEVTANGTLIPTADVTFINSTLIRVTVPASFFQQPGPLVFGLQSQGGTKFSGTVSLTVIPVRPVVIAATPNSVQQSGGGVSLTSSLTGGYFVPGKTLATFNGLGCGGGAACTSFVDSRHLNVAIQDPALTVPGLYPLVVQTSDAVTAGVPSLTGLNLAVNPAASAVAKAPNSTLPMGTTATPGSTAVAMDLADGLAVVANTTEGSVTIVNMLTDSVGATIATGTKPTGVAVDDMATPHHLAYVVNSGDNTVSIIDLVTVAKVATLSLATYEPSVIPAATVPYSIGVNPLTHRAFIANQSTNVGTILDLANANTAVGCATPPCPVGVITGGITAYGTGQNPQVAIDPRLNWAMVTPGGAGTIGIVDLGRAPSTGLIPDVGRRPELIASLSISSTVQGVGINTETHEALLADPVAQTLSTFNLMSAAVQPVTFTFQGTSLATPNLASAAVTPLENLGIAVQNTATGATGVIADLDSGIVLARVNGLGAQPEAVAVDPASNQAIVVDAADNTASIISLGPALTQPQIIEANPAMTFTSTANVPLIITGANFAAGAVVRLDQTSICSGANPCTVTPRQITTTIPSSLLASARHYLLDVQNTGGAVSNVEDLTVVQPIKVGNGPVAVAIDTDRDLAVVTNTNDNTVSLVSLSSDNGGVSPESLGDVGVLPTGGTVSTGTTPEGVAVDPRLGIAVVANNGSNNVTVLDETTSVALPAVALCGADCLDATGVAIDNDLDTAVVTSTNANILFTNGDISLVGVGRTNATTITAALGGSVVVDQDPVAVAVDPTLAFAGVATASSTSELDIVGIKTGTIVGRVNNLQNPSGVVFDPVNQVFITVNSLLNNIVLTDPSSANSTTVSVGIAPTSVDYNFQTSSLVTLNAGSHTMSVLDYTCPPNSGPTCFNPQVRAVFGLGGAQSSTLVLGPNGVAVDPKLNIAVVVDPDNNRILMVPLPH